MSAENEHLLNFKPANFNSSSSMNFNPTRDAKQSHFNSSPAMDFKQSNQLARGLSPMPRLTLGPPISTQFGRSIDQITPPSSSGGGGGGAPVVLPFKMKDASPDVAHPKVNVVTGTVMDFTPTGIATDTALTDNATNTVYLDCTINADGLVTAVAMSLSTSGKPADSTYHAYLLIGTATVASGVVTLAQSLYFSQGFKACDRDAGDPATTPGSYQFFVR